MQPTGILKFESHHRVTAFTLVELVVIVAVVGLGALCLLPALARTKPETGVFQCLNNQRQLARAWRMYADDNNDRFVGMVDGVDVMVNNPRGPWVQGWMSWTSMPDVTNTVLLTDSRYAALANYCGRDARVFKCPADRFISAVQRNSGWVTRVRSVSGNLCVGGVDPSGFTQPPYIIAKKWNELLNPKPAETWLFMDEHPDSINDGAIFASSPGQWIDLPANYHDGGAGIAYADGRSEIHRWLSSVMNRQVLFTTYNPIGVPANDPDFAWLRARTPKRPGFN